MVNGFPSHFWSPSLIRRIPLTLRNFFGGFVLITLLLTLLPKSLLCLSHVVIHLFGLSCRGSKWKWLMDAISGYNQIRFSKSSREKLAFSGPNCTNYTYYVMPFVPINGPVILIVLIHDMESTWKEVSATRGIVIDAKNGTRLIVDDIYIWGRYFQGLIEHLKCQLDVCLYQNILLSLKNASYVQRESNL